MSEEKAPDGSFWSTLPGTLTAVAGLIAAVGGLLTALVLSGVIGSDPTTTTATLPTTTTIVPATTTVPPTTTTTVEPTEAERESLVIDLLAFDEVDWASVENYRGDVLGNPPGTTTKTWGGTIRFDWVLSPGPGGVTTGIDSWIFYTEQCWDPAERGAIESITFTVGRKMLYAQETSRNDLNSKFVAERFGFRIFREGTEKIYFPEAQVPFNNTSMELTETLPLGAADFEDNDGLPPDFSDSGEEMCFGLLRSISNQDTVGIEVGHELDNFGVTVTPAGS